MNDWYEITVKGHLDKDWAERFEGLTIRHNDQGGTVLSGRIVDPPALRGLLNRLFDLGLVLLSVYRVDRDTPGPAGGM